MAKYRVDIEWSGYSRGVSSYEVEAESAEEAGDNYYEGECTSEITVRDDRDSDVSKVTLL